MWRVADKVVFSRTLESVSSARTRIEATFDPYVIQEMKSSAKSDLTVAGAKPAALAFRAGLIDERHLLLNLIGVGGGRRALPSRIARGLSCWMRGDLPTALSTFTTAGPIEDRQRRRLRPRRAFFPAGPLGQFS